MSYKLSDDEDDKPRKAGPMVQGTPQFTPAQVLEAGRRAEAEGKLDYAVQFFRHLATHYPSTSEAQAAREGLQRLAAHHPAAGAALSGLAARGSDAGSTQPANPRPGGVNGSSDAPVPPPFSAVAGQGQSSPPQPPPLQPAPPPGARPAGPPSQLGAPHRPIGADHHLAPPRGPRPLDIELPGDRYRSGRLLSRLFSLVGLLVTLLGVVVLLIAITGGLMPKIVTSLGAVGMMAYAFGFYAGPGLLVTGLTLIHWGQITRAMLDNSNATQDLLAIERAKSGVR